MAIKEGMPRLQPIKAGMPRLQPPTKSGMPRLSPGGLNTPIGGGAFIAEGGRYVGLA